MRSSFNGRNRGKSVSFRPNTDENISGDSNDREGNNNIKDFKQSETDEPRTVTLLPDANMTISVHNDFRDTKNKLRSRGSHSILKSNSFRDDAILISNNKQNNQNSNRGFETYNSRGRGRGRPRGLYHGYQSGEYEQEYVHNQDNSNQRNYRNRPLSGSYEYNHDYSGHYYGRQSSDNYNQNYDNKSQEYPQYGQRNYRVRQSSANYETENNYKQEQQVGSTNFRGRSKSASDRLIRGRRGQQFKSGRFAKDNEDGRKTDDGVGSRDGHDDNKEKREVNESQWLQEEDYHKSAMKDESTLKDDNEGNSMDKKEKSNDLNVDGLRGQEINSDETYTNEVDVGKPDEKIEVQTSEETVKE